MIKRCAIVAPDLHYCVIARQERLLPDDVENDTIAPHAILQAFAEARGAEVRGGTIFCSMMPCPECMKLAGANQIKQIVYREERPNAAEARKCEGIAAYYDIKLVRNEDMSV